MNMVRDGSLLREHDFRQLFAASAISHLGSQISILALPLSAVLALNASTFEVGLLTACGTVAFLLVGLPAGAWVDRLSRRRVLIVGDIGRALALLTVPLAWWLELLSMPQLYLVALTVGVLTVFFDVAYQSYLPHLVGREHLVEGNAKLEAVRSVSQIGGPTVAGVVIQALTAPIAIALNGLSFLASAVYLKLIRRGDDRPRGGASPRLAREVGEGMRFVFGNPMLRAIAVSIASYNLFSGIRVALLVVLLARDLKLAAGTIGAFYSIAAIGGLLGAFTATWVARRIGQGPAIWVPLAVAAPFHFAIPLVQPGWALWAAALAYLVIWCSVSINNITQLSFRQRLTPERMLGRMNATMRFLVWGTTPLGGMLGGVLGQTLGVRPVLWLAAFGASTALIPLLISPLRAMRTLPTLPDDTAVLKR